MEVSEEVVKEQIIKAIDLFRQRDYHRSLVAYNEIVTRLSDLPTEYCTKLRRYYDLRERPIAGKLCHPKLTSVLDQRAATYEKLGQLQLALRDTKKVLLLDPLECKGYLRQGKLLLDSGERVKAYKCYQKGIYFIEEAERSRDFLANKKHMRQLHIAYSALNKALKEERRETLAVSTSATSSRSETSLATKAPCLANKDNHTSGNMRSQGRIDDMLPVKRPSQQDHKVFKKARNPIDPMERLPLELIGEIYSHINVEQILKSHLVCKHWYNTLLKLPWLYLGSITLKNNVMFSEFSNCMVLLKKVLKSTHSRYVNRIIVPTTFKENHLQRILQVLLQTNLRIKALGITSIHFSIELLLQLLVRLSWGGLDKFLSLDRLFMTINSSFAFNDILPQLCPILTHLEILIIDRVQKISAVQSDMLHQLAQKVEEGIFKYRGAPENATSSGEIIAHQQLKSLVLVNQRVAAKFPGPDTDSEGMHKVKPSMLSIRMPNLCSLTVACFDLTGYSSTLTTFLSGAHHLKNVDFESNLGLSLDKFLRILVLNGNLFELEVLRFREMSRSGPLDLDDINLDDMKCLFNLRELDLYGSSLSNKALLKLLRLSRRIQTLNIGNSKYIYFKNTQFTRHNLMNWAELFQLLPELQILYMPEMDFDHLTMSQFNQGINEVYGAEKFNFVTLDLSFCHQIDGISLLYLFEASNNGDAGHCLSVYHLVLNGLTINMETLQLLKRKSYVHKIENDPFRNTWRSWGVNSHCVEIKSNRAV